MATAEGGAPGRRHAPPDQPGGNGDPAVPAPESGAVTRRAFLRGAGGIAVGALGAQGTAAQEAEQGADQGSGEGARLAGTQEIELAINGEARKLKVEPRTTLLSALRVRLEGPLTGSKEVCDRGACGACTVLLDGEPVYSCMLLALDCVGREITTVEGLGSPEKLSEVQAAFCEKDALMCGFCTPGFVVSVSACLERDPRSDLEAVQRACAGNLCRCGTYPHVFEAALAAGRKLGGR